MIRSRRIGLVHLSLALFALAVIGRSAYVQLAQGRMWRMRAARQQYSSRALPAPRGEILDGSGATLATNRETVQLEVAPNDVRQPGALRAALVNAGVAPLWIARALDRHRVWVVIPGQYVAGDVQRITALRGVYSTPTTQRTYASSFGEGLLQVVGHVDPNGRPLDGVELALDSVLRGSAGSTTSVRDVRGRRFESPAAPQTAPRLGNTVVLSLRHELQEIADHALTVATDRPGVAGGDIVILDPRTGEVMAMSSRRTGASVSSVTALTEPFEPGSTMKPFIAAGLLARGRVSDRDSVDTRNGVLEIEGRRIHDEHLVGKVPLADVLRWSSNVGIVKFGARLTPREEYETLRDFGFGTPTGVAFPTEATGTLRDPSKWSRQSAASLAIGYEVAATPIQLALAYAAFANGGELLEPSLVKEIRTPDGRVLYRHLRRVVRQVIQPVVAERIRAMLMNVVADGTALQADLSNYPVAGKTGTPRATVAGHYAALRYNPNFVALFPGDDPQYVIVVKLTVVEGSYFAATTAAPLTKSVLEAAIAARNVALDRAQLLSSTARATAVPGLPSVGQRTSLSGASTPSPASASPTVPDESVPYVVELASKRSTEASARASSRPIPNVRGVPLRDAVLALHDAGFRVQLVRGSGEVTTPSAGSVAAPGTLVRLQYPY